MLNDAEQPRATTKGAEWVLRNTVEPLYKDGLRTCSESKASLRSRFFDSGTTVKLRRQNTMYFERGQTRFPPVTPPNSSYIIDICLRIRMDFH
jgi:hypothetical protein